MTISRQAAERAFAIEVVKTLREAGHEAYWAGGCVRDQILGLIPEDFDIATSAHPEQVRRLFPRTVAVGISFGVINVIHFLPNPHEQPIQIEVATFRIDGGYSDGRRPDQVTFCSAREDALRRDFTINGMFYDPIAEKVLDFVGGKQDLSDRILRAIGEPHLRFQEDKLRLLRAVRIASRFNLTIEAKTESSIRTLALEVRQCSAERIADELRKLLVHPNRTQGMRILVDLGIAAAVLPEILLLKGVPQFPGENFSQGPNRGTDLWEHVLQVLNLLKAPSFPLAFATLLHELGRVYSPDNGPGNSKPFDTNNLSAEIAGKIGSRLKMSNEERDRIGWLIANHQIFRSARTLPMSRLKPLLIHPGIRELIALHRADASANNESEEPINYCEQLLRDLSPEELDPIPLITGHDLKHLGVNPGPIYKRLLDSVREQQLDSVIQTREEAISLVQQLLTQS